MRSLIIWASLSVAVVGVGCGGGQTSPPATAATAAAPSFTMMQPGEVVPAYAVRSLDGSVVEIGAGQPRTLLNLWATWCAPCRAEFPDLERLHQELQDSGLRILAVDIDAESPETLYAVMEDLGLTLPVARDTSGLIQQAFPSIGVPTSFLLSETGELIRTWTGVIPAEDYDFIREYVRSGGG